MEKPVVGAVVVVFISFLCCFQVGLSQGEAYVKNYLISWDDIKVEEQKLRLSHRDDNYRRRVIVVDKNGGGDSLTVQGAIDMVPEYNTERKKIYILPGIYRFAYAC